MPQRIESPAWFRRMMLGLIVCLVLAEVGIAWSLFRLLRMFTPGPPESIASLLGALGIATLFQGAACAAVAAMALGVAWTTVEIDAQGLTLQSPFRRWRGPWTAVRRVYRTRGLLAIEIAGAAFGSFTVHPGPDAAAAVGEIFRRVPRDAALDDAATRWYLARRALPLLLAVAALGAVTLRLLEHVLPRLGPR